MSSTIGSDVSSIHNTFSSWDNCMAKGYCKWPVIIAIIIVSLIVFSVIWCVARCLCCGLECCCACLSCCNACCPSPRGKRRVEREPPRENPYHTPPLFSNSQYRSPAAAAPSYAPAVSPYGGAKTATFDAPSQKTAHYNEDALPAMPTWEKAKSHQVEEEVEEVEMEKLPIRSRAESPPPLPPQQISNLHQQGAAHSDHDLNEQFYGSGNQTQPQQPYSSVHRAMSPPQPGNGTFPGQRYPPAAGFAGSPPHSYQNQAGFHNPQQNMQQQPMHADEHDNEPPAAIMPAGTYSTAHAAGIPPAGIYPAGQNGPRSPLQTSFGNQPYDQRPHAGDADAFQPGPYNNQTGPRQFNASPYGSQRSGSSSVYPPTYRTNDPVATSPYDNDYNNGGFNNATRGPGSYRSDSNVPSPLSPTFAQSGPRPSPPPGQRPYRSPPPQQFQRPGYQGMSPPMDQQQRPYRSPPPQNQQRGYGSPPQDQQRGYRSPPPQQYQQSPYQNSSSPPPQDQQQRAYRPSPQQFSRPYPPQQSQPQPRYDGGQF